MGQPLVLKQAVELTEGCINPLLFSTSALAHLKNMVHSDVNYIKFSDVCVRTHVCLCVRGRPFVFETTSAVKHINQLVLGDKHTKRAITFHMGFLGFKVAAVH